MSGATVAIEFGAVVGPSGLARKPGSPDRKIRGFEEFGGPSGFSEKSDPNSKIPQGPARVLRKI
jgi:hypothetical protein